MTECAATRYDDSAMANISFGERMRRGRIQNAWTQAELAEKVGVTGATISNWEKEKTAPSKEQKDHIRKILGIKYGGKTASASAESANRTTASAAVEAPSAFGTWLSRTRLEKRMSVAELAEFLRCFRSCHLQHRVRENRKPSRRNGAATREGLDRDLPAETKEELKEESTMRA